MSARDNSKKPCIYCGFLYWFSCSNEETQGCWGGKTFSSEGEGRGCSEKSKLTSLIVVNRRKRNTSLGLMSTTGPLRAFGRSMQLRGSEMNRKREKKKSEDEVEDLLQDP